jgi:phage terminase large subunit-like protein
MMAFPSGKHDDMVDSLSQGLNWLAQKQQFDGVQRLRVL